jgi:hypothetical protein
VAKSKRAQTVPDHLRARISLRVAPVNWLEKARQLRKSANLLFVVFENEQLEFGKQFERDPSLMEGWPDDTTILLLLGFAVENLLKGLFVSALPEPRKIKELKALGMPLCLPRVGASCQRDIAIAIN